jgi:cytochrome c
MTRLLAFAALLLSVSPGVLAEDRATTRQAEALVHKAVEYLKKEGPEKAYATFSDPQGPFTYRDLYVTVYDMKGKCLAHGAKKERIGRSLIDDKDADGKLFVKERVEIAAKDGKGWQEYKFLNPANQKVEVKIAYLEAVDGVIVVCGAYKG